MRRPVELRAHERDAAKFSEAMKQQEIAFDVYPYVAGSTILRKDMLCAPTRC